MRQLIRSRLPAGNFARNVITMAGATAGGQVIVLVALPFLTRLYRPAEFGAAAAFAALIGLFLIVATFRYELAIPLPRSDSAAFHLVALSFCILFVVAPVAGITWVFVHPWLDLDVGVNDKTFAVLAAISVLAGGAYQTLSYWLVRKKRFGAIAITRIQQGLAGNGTQVAAGIAGLGTLGLIAGQIIGQFAGLTRLAAEFRRDSHLSRGRIQIPRFVRVAKRYQRFPLFDTWAGLLGVVGAQAPIVLFTVLFSPTLAGYYALSYRFLSAPMGLVGTAISKPLLSRLVDARRAGDVAPLMAKLLQALAMVSLPPFAVIAIISDEFVPLAFGPEWGPAAVVVTWTATWVGWQFLCSPLSVILIAIEAQKLNSVLQFGLVVVRVSALLAGAALGSAQGALVGFSIASIAGYSVYVGTAVKASGLSAMDMFRALYHPVAIFGLCMAVSVMVPMNLMVVKYTAIVCILAYWALTCWSYLGQLLRAPTSPGQRISL